MNKTVLLKKLECILEEAERTGMFGTLEIDIRGGRPTVIRTTKTDRLDGENPRHAQKTY